MTSLPETQYAIQLVGQDKITLNKSKKITPPGPHQILCRVRAVGLCFSDLKLLKQFSSHARKSGVVSGIDPHILEEIPSYVPGDAPTVPGHEAVVTIEAVGPNVEKYKVGQRYLVQTDYRWLRTATSNAAFGYNFEGALQEYVLMDERVITSPEGESMLLGVSEGLSDSAIALVEPWACVEDAYISRERQSVKTDDRMLIVADAQADAQTLANFFERYGRAAQITWVAESPAPELPGPVERSITPDKLASLQDAAYDDILYFGSNPQTVEALLTKLAAKGLLNITMCGGRFGREVVVPVGRVHYGGIRVVGTTGSDPASSMQYIPQNDEIRPGETINIVGAGGPMGMMHVIRSLCEGIRDVAVYAGDLDENRLAVLTKVAAPLAEKNKKVIGIRGYTAYNPRSDKLNVDLSYIALMVPVPGLVAAAVGQAAKHGIINVFAGIPASVAAKIDLDAYIEKQLYFVGTSGSVLADMKRVLAKVESGKLDTNLSMAAICGLDGATEGIRAVENRSVSGKIVVYPACKGLGLLPLDEVSGKMPEVAAKMKNGLWTSQAEEVLLKTYK